MSTDETWEYVPKIGEFYYLISVPGETCFRVTAVDEVTRTVRLRSEDGSTERTKVGWDELSDESVN